VCQRPPTHQQQLFPREPSSRHRFHFSPPVMSSAANTASTKSITTGNHFVRLLLHIEPHEVANPSDPSSSTGDNRSDPATPTTSSWIAQSMPPLPWPLPTRDGARSSGAHRQLEDAPSRHVRQLEDAMPVTSPPSSTHYHGASPAVPPCPTPLPWIPPALPTAASHLITPFAADGRATARALSAETTRFTRVCPAAGMGWQGQLGRGLFWPTTIHVFFLFQFHFLT
jgi:hypothetical protein